MDPIPALIAQLDKDRLIRHLFHLSSDPLPFRKLNYTRPGADRSTLHEADDFIAGQLENYGYTVEKEAVPVQALRPDRSRPLPHQFARPAPTDPWYTAYNLYARKTGATHPDEYLVVIAHKDSQSWTDSPGALDDPVRSARGLLKTNGLLTKALVDERRRYAARPPLPIDLATGHGRPAGLRLAGQCARTHPHPRGGRRGSGRPAWARPP